MTETISSFTQLRTWQKARTFALMVYRVTGLMPESEKYGLTSQLRRASVSIAANIAEGFSRNTAKEKVNFYNIALGSLTEVESHLYIASDLEFVAKTDLDNLLNEIMDLRKMTKGLMKSAEGRTA